MENYPEFNYVIENKEIPSIVDYDVLNVELNGDFSIKSKKYNLNIKSCKGIGMIYIKTKINDPQIGIEWQSINAFIYKDSEIVQNLIKISFDNNNNDFYENGNDDIISLNQLEDADYEMNLMYEEELNEDFYENITRHKEEGLRNNKIYENYYDLVFLYENDFYIQQGLDMDNLMKVDLTYNSKEPKKFFDDYSDLYGKTTEIKDSKFYQDGILMHFNPQQLIPLGVGWSICNLTADARFDLNVSRHEINMSRENIDLWINKYGTIIQEKVVKNCTEVFNKLGLKLSIDKNIKTNSEDNYFKIRCCENIKVLLNNYINSN
jgi:hypothetical protein